MSTLVNKIKIVTTMRLLSGLHIGDSKENAEIGGIDSPVVRRKDNKQPYIPGSSIKGKIRCLLEQIAGISEVGGGMKQKYSSKTQDCQKIIDAFGFANDGFSSRIIVRDAYLTEESVKILNNSDNTDMPFTEAKWENSINRVTGKAEDPRQIERIPAGVSFRLVFIVNDFDDNKTHEVKSILLKGIKALNNDYLGGSGSRGYGHVKVDLPGETGSAWKEEIIAL
ncbi:MAG: type III-A CRISPR-associated RAMP protein Csm3 [Bacteroidales bacterium]|nr:type III-A CRISPR-associated RAMP protein Csm3 [Bacteroidales bacterium]